MKQKARDIISGWLKGRTTITSFDFDNDVSYRFNIFKEVRFIMYPFTEYSKQAQEDKVKYKFEEHYETTYHQMQQAMVNEWFASYRLGDTIHSDELKQRIYWFGVEQRINPKYRRVSELLEI